MLKTTFENDPYQKKTADTSTGMKKDLLNRSLASSWRVCTLSMVRTVATSMNVKSIKAVGSKRCLTVFECADERIKLSEV
jgi:hypothetical protein